MPGQACLSGPTGASDSAWMTRKLSLRRVWRRAAELASAFFDADDHECVDPLVEVAQRNPVAAAQFVKVVMRLGAAGGLVVAGASLAFLGLFWSRCADCDRPFRWWLLVHALLQILQVPVRVVFLRKLMASERVGGNVAQCVTSLTASPAWRSIRVVSFITYAWFILGIVWIMNAAPCSACPGITSLMAGLILQTIARVAVALIFSRTLFLQIPTAEQTRRVEAADPADVQALPTLTFSEQLFPEGMSCAICLCEFEGRAHLRRLPCGHHFHVQCVDAWLRRSKRCPLCMTAIDAAGCGHRHNEVVDRGSSTLIRRERH